MSEGVCGNGEGKGKGKGEARQGRTAKSRWKRRLALHPAQHVRRGVPEVRGTVNTRGSTVCAGLAVALTSEKVLLMLSLIDAVLDTAPTMIVTNAARVTASALTRKIRSKFIAPVGTKKMRADFFKTFRGSNDATRPPQHGQPQSSPRAAPARHKGQRKARRRAAEGAWRGKQSKQRERAEGFIARAGTETGTGTVMRGERDGTHTQHPQHRSPTGTVHPTAHSAQRLYCFASSFFSSLASTRGGGTSSFFSSFARFFARSSSLSLGSELSSCGSSS